MVHDSQGGWKKWEKKGIEGVWKGDEGEYGKGMRRNGEWGGEEMWIWRVSYFGLKKAMEVYVCHG